MARFNKTTLGSLLRTAWSVARLPRTLHILIGVGVFLALLGIVGAFVVSPLAHRTAEQQLSKLLDRPVTIGSLSLNPYTLKVEADRVHIGERGGNGDFVDADRVIVRPSWLSLFRLAPIIGEVRLVAPHVSIVRFDAQRFNFSDLVDKFSAPSPNPHKKSMPFSVSNIRVENGRIDFDDRLLHEKHVIDQWALGIPYIATAPSKTNIFVEPMLHARIDGSPIAIDGKTKPFASSRESEVTVQVNSLDVPRLLTYSPKKLPFIVNSGKLSTNLVLDFMMTSAAPALKISGTADLSGVNVTDTNGAPFVDAKALHVAAASLEPLHEVYHFDDIRLDGPTVNLAREADGTLSVQRMFAQPRADSKAGQNKGKDATPQKEASANADGTPFDLSIGHFALNGGTLNWRDATTGKPANLALANLNATLDNFSTTAKTPAHYTFDTGAGNGGTVSASGTVELAAKTADAKITVAALALAPLQPYLDSVSGAQVSDGKLGANLTLTANWAKTPAAVQIGQSTLQLDALKMLARGEKKPAITLAHGEVQLTQADLVVHNAQVAQVSANGLAVDVEHRRDGSINLARLAQASHGPATHSPAAATQKSGAQGQNAWHYQIGAVDVTNGQVRFVDSTTPREVRLDVTPLQLKVQQISDDLSRPLPVQLKATVNRKGTLAVEGNVSPMPVKATLRLDANRLDVVAFEPYFDRVLNAVMASALLNARGHLALAQGRTWHAHYHGDVALVDVRMLEKSTSGPFMGWRALDLSNLKVDYGDTGTDVDVHRVISTGFYARALLDAQGKLNLGSIVARNGQQGSPTPASSTFTSAAASGAHDASSPAAADTSHAVASNSTAASVSNAAQPVATAVASAAVATSASNVAAASAPPPASSTQPAQSTQSTQSTQSAQSSQQQTEHAVRLHFGEIVLKSGRMNYTDNFIRPNYRATLTDIHGTIGAFGTQSAEPAPIDVAAKLVPNGPIVIKGTVNPLLAKPSLDLSASAHDIELPNLTPYSTKYAGYPIIKGKLNVDLHYQLANDQLTANNHLFIDQFTFGEHVDNDTATKLPVRLAISLLKNAKGQIDVNIPVSGLLSNPEFSLGGLIWHAVLRLIEKAVTAPFSLLADAFGGGTEELGYVAFDPGSSRLTDTDDKKLDTIVKALADKPDVKIDLTGRVDPALDTPALGAQAVDRQIRQMMQKDKMGNGQSVDMSALRADDKDYLKYLTKLYRGGNFKKPHNFIGMTKTLPADQMKAALAAHANVTDSMLRELAQRRAQAVQQYFNGKVDASRVFVVAPKLNAQGITDKGATTRVDFGLE